MTNADLALSTETKARMDAGLPPIDGTYRFAGMVCDVENGVITIRATHSSDEEVGEEFYAPAYRTTVQHMTGHILYAIPDRHPSDPRGSDEIIMEARMNR